MSKKIKKTVKNKSGKIEKTETKIKTSKRLQSKNENQQREDGEMKPNLSKINEKSKIETMQQRTCLQSQNQNQRRETQKSIMSDQNGRFYSEKVENKNSEVLRSQDQDKIENRKSIVSKRMRKSESETVIQSASKRLRSQKENQQRDELELNIKKRGEKCKIETAQQRKSTRLRNKNQLFSKQGSIESNKVEKTDSETLHKTTSALHLPTVSKKNENQKITSTRLRLPNKNQQIAKRTPAEFNPTTSNDYNKKATQKKKRSNGSTVFFGEECFIRIERNMLRKINGTHDLAL